MVYFHFIHSYQKGYHDQQYKMNAKISWISYIFNTSETHIAFNSFRLECIKTIHEFVSFLFVFIFMNLFHLLELKFISNSFISKGTFFKSFLTKNKMLKVIHFESSNGLEIKSIITTITQKNKQLCELNLKFGGEMTMDLNVQVKQCLKSIPTLKGNLLFTCSLLFDNGTHQLHD